MQTRKENIVDNYHGTLVSDPYRWLEKDEEPEVLAWVWNQQARTADYLSEIPVGQLRQRLNELWDYTRSTPPRKAGEWYFFQRNDGLQNQPVLYRQKGLDAQKEALLDPNKWDGEGTVAISGFSVDDSGKYLAYTISAKGSDRQKIRILDLDTREHLAEVLQWCRFTNMAWVGREGFYYDRYPRPGTVAKEDENNYNEVYWHQIGTEQEDDVLVYGRPDDKELHFMSAVTADQHYLVLHVSRGTDSRNGFYYSPLPSRDEFVSLMRQGQAKYWFLGNEGERFYFLTNEQAPRGRLIGVDLSRPEKEHWEEILPEQSDVISEARFVQGTFVVSFMHNAYSLVRTYDKQGRLLKEVPLPAMGSVETLTAKQNDSEVFMSFSSFLHPGESLRYDLAAEALEPFDRPELNFEPADFETKQIFYPSKDGTKVSLFIVHKKGLKLDGSNPTLLYGYGGFNIPITPLFAPSRLLWLEQGGVYAVANLRGGSEYGEEWHQAGMLENKQNVFDDFIAAAEWLIEQKYTRPERLAIEGRSNGGLLVSACLVQRPELFGAVICAVPVTDMLRYHRFTVGRFWVPEYGNGEENPEHFQFLYRYSPLHNVKPGKYPATLVVTADGDDRVVPGHAYKFLATLQEAQRGSDPILLRVDTAAGHGHGKPVSKVIAEHADVNGFLLKNLGVL